MAEKQVVLSARIRWGKLRDLGPALTAVQMAMLREAAEQLRKTAPRHLRDKIRVTKSSIIIDDDSALAIEFGSRAHFPPIAGLLDWAASKGKPAAAAYRIQRVIGERGTKPKPFMEPAIERTQQRADAVMGAAWDTFFRIPGL